MNGISKEKYNEILDFIQEWHPFVNLTKDRSKYPNMCKFGLGIKYVNAFYDTRTKDIYKIVIYEYGTKEVDFNVMNITENDIRKKYYDIYEYIMDYLKGNIKL